MRARQRNASDEFLLPTLLGAAFDAGDVDAAQALFEEIAATDAFQMEARNNDPDLELSLRHLTDADGRAALRAESWTD